MAADVDAATADEGVGHGRRLGVDRDEQVVADAAVDDVPTGVVDEDVGLGLAEQVVVARAADHRVGAAAGFRRTGGGGREAVEQVVVAALAVEAVVAEPTDDEVGAGSALEVVDAGPAEDDVVAGVAGDRVGSAAAADDVGVVAGVDGVTPARPHDDVPTEVAGHGLAARADHQRGPLAVAVGGSRGGGVDLAEQVVQRPVVVAEPLTPVGAAGWSHVEPRGGGLGEELAPVERRVARVVADDAVVERIAVGVAGTRRVAQRRELRVLGRCEAGALDLVADLVRHHPAQLLGRWSARRRRDPRFLDADVTGAARRGGAGELVVRGAGRVPRRVDAAEGRPQGQVGELLTVRDDVDDDLRVHGEEPPAGSPPARDRGSCRAPPRSRARRSGRSRSASPGGRSGPVAPAAEGAAAGWGRGSRRRRGGPPGTAIHDAR